MAVYDSGIGIKEDKMEEVFREFYQLHNPERDRSKGLGLGLAIVKRMVELLDVSLLSASVPNKGSMFALIMPKVSLLQQNVVVSKKGSNPVFFAGKWVLIIDDEMEVRDSLSELLQSWHCEVIAAASSKEAIEFLHDGRVIPDVILADYRLRDSETGNDVIDKIRSIYSESRIPAIIITGDTAPDRIKEANASGYKIIHKPVLPDKLRLILGDILS